MSILEELFTDVAKFREYSPYTESNVTFEELASSGMSAVKQVKSLLTTDIYNTIISSDDAKKEALRSAVANLTLAKQLVFNILSLRKSEVDVYKNEQEQMRRAYRDNYFNSMDSLLQLLDNDEAWKKTPMYSVMQSLKIKSAAEFDAVYPIDSSYMYFFRCIPLQQEALDDYVGSYYDRLEDNDKTTRRKLDRCLAKFTVALSLRRFDILEFPVTIRNLFEETTASRNGTQEQERMLDLSNELMSQAQESLKSIDLILSSDKDTNIVTQTSFNQSEDKIYLMA